MLKIKIRVLFLAFIFAYVQGIDVSIAAPENFTGDVIISDNTVDKALEISGYTDIQNSAINASLNHSGAVKIYQSTLQNVSSNGITYIEQKSALTGDLTATGKLTIHDSQIAGKTIVNGTANVQNVRFSGDFSGSGRLEAQNSTFKNITIESSKIDLIDSRADSLFIKKMRTPNTLQTVTISGNSKITNKIIFEGGNGQVITRGHLVEIGKVEGGSIKHE